jgi:hypothetical protein
MHRSRERADGKPLLVSRREASSDAARLHSVDFLCGSCSVVHICVRGIVCGYGAESATLRRVEVAGFHGVAILRGSLVRLRAGNIQLWGEFLFERKRHHVFSYACDCEALSCGETVNLDDSMRHVQTLVPVRSKSRL